ncbi:MAG: O-antigen ligase family protein [Acidobacteria bacterium]|nr:O-antigen ligase family protein [Acidobacteriota bacterium]
MTSRPLIDQREQIKKSGGVSSRSSFSNWLSYFDALSAVKDDNLAARWANRAIVFFLLLFSLSLPHSIAAAQISLDLTFIAWIARDLTLRRFHFARTPIDLPLLCFASLTIISSVFSVEPSISLRKLKTLLLFGVIYIVATNLRPRGVHLLAGMLVVSSLVGVGFSLMEKFLGRGMIVAAIEPDSPLAGNKLQVGDVIWMIARQRVFTQEDVFQVIGRHREGEIIEVEALHAGDPVPVALRVTEEIKTRSNPLGISIGGRSRQFRVSGFSRQFQTYAEQMQIFAMLICGGLLTCFKLWRRRKRGFWLIIFCLLFLFFSTALVLTASRAVIAAFIITVFFVSISIGSRLASIIAIATALLLGGLGFYVITTARQQTMMSFDDDSTTRRIAYMQAGLRVIPNHPLIGVGMDSHKRHWREWGFPGEYITHTHSTPIQIAMDRGLPALVSFVWLMAAMMLMARRSYKRAEKRGDDFGQSLTLGAFGALIGFSASSLTNYNFGDSEALMLLLFVIALVVVKSNNVSEFGGNSPRTDTDATDARG